jgi:hypothetical protein
MSIRVMAAALCIVGIKSLFKLYRIDHQLVDTSDIASRNISSLHAGGRVSRPRILVITNMQWNYPGNEPDFKLPLSRIS